MFSRLVARPLRVAGTRPYSGFFSSSKPPGGLVKPQQNVVKRSSSSTEMSQPTSTPTPEAPSLPSPTPVPRMHPSPVLATMHLHSFFSLDRPMLLLSQPTSRLFTTDPPKRQSEEAEDADADAARSLSHALVMSRVEGAAVWADTLARLGVPADPVPSDVEMDSVKRKRRKKITKHNLMAHKAHPTSVLDIHTPTASFSIAHSLQQDSLQLLFDRLGAKANVNVGPGMVKYGWQDGPVFNLDDDADYSILLWKASSGTETTLHVPTLHLHDPATPFPAPGAYRNPAFYAFKQHDIGIESTVAGKSKKGSRKAKSVKSQMSGSSDGLVKHKRDFLNFHAENGVRTVHGKIGPVDNVRMLLKKGYRHVYVSRAFAKRHGFIPRDAMPGLYGFNGLVHIGKWPITLGRTTTQHDVYLSEETHFDVVLGRAFMERRAIITDLVDLTKVVCGDTGETVDCDVVVIRDGTGDIVTVT
ncbi:unnamed protein product [Rhizoctonia solani]|uniref:Uncharacterized protein n=1 Tax=Rhizoctonia solani TaxID=456999 RepID=A0A8H3DZR9_9AGAM|nr:unnamed protein product [Rhizoctonia solani]